MSETGPSGMHADTAGEAARVTPDERQSPSLHARELAGMAAGALAVLLPSHAGWWSIPPAEAWGFATGGICVWLVVREHVANWPVGLANTVFFFALFLNGRLYADMGLQVVYFTLGIYGWWNWCRGGPASAPLRIRRTSTREWLALTVSVPLATLGIREVLLAVNGAAPFFDAATTALSLAAQYLLCQKRLENWWFWLLADAGYVPLYVSRGLPLIALLYGVFFVMCVVGLRQWSGTLHAQEARR